MLYFAENRIFLIIETQTGLTNSSHMTKLEDATYISMKKELFGRKPRTMLSLTKRGREVFESYRKLMATYLIASQVNFAPQELQ